MTLKLFCWLWQQPGGRTNYTAAHVNVWAAMVRRHLTLPHTLACVTATPEGIDPSIEIIAPPDDFGGLVLPTWGGGLPNCLRRIALFRPDAAEVFGAERFVSMDMDCVVAKSLDPLFDRPDDFVMYRGTNASRPYNGSMVMLTAGARRRVFDEFTPERAIAAGWKYVGSDQAWISAVLGRGEATWGREDGVEWWGSVPNTYPARLMFFPGTPKPWDLIPASGWVSEHYRAASVGRCSIVGFRPDPWLGFDGGAAIVSPEASEHMPGALVCGSEMDAIRVAKALGYEPVICGRPE